MMAVYMYILPYFVDLCFLLSVFDYEFVTCGSSLKLLNTHNNVRLHSHDVKYGSGSGQQVFAVSRL